MYMLGGFNQKFIESCAADDNDRRTLSVDESEVPENAIMQVKSTDI